jgi:phage terminase large subunit
MGMVMMKDRPRITTASRQDYLKLGTIVRDPVKYVKGILGHDPWSVQAEILRAVDQHPRVAVKACHASSKTFSAAEAMLWWITRYRDGIAITTAPKFEQVQKQVFAEIHKALHTSRFAYPRANQTELKLDAHNYAVGLSTNIGVRFQGFHGNHILIVLDEAPGIEADIWEAIEGARAGGDVHVLALGNPTVVGGPFYDAFAGQRAQWKTITIDAFDTPNLQGFTPELLKSLPPDLPEDDPIFHYRPRPYLVTRRWVYEKFHEWGEQSALWQSRVRGQFPEQSDDALISLAGLEAAKKRSPQPDPGHGRDLVAGVDVAGPGSDECVCYLRRGDSIVGFKAWSTPDPRGLCVAFLSPYKARLEAVNVDAIGLGYNFGMHLQDQGFPVSLINVGQAAHDSRRFANLKAQYYWGLRERIQAGELAGLSDDHTIAQLASIRWQATAQGKIAIASKEELRRRGIKSPDRAEALMLAFAEHPFFAAIQREVQRLRTQPEVQLHGWGEKVAAAPTSNPLLERYNQMAPEYIALRNKGRLKWPSW